jgi:hypothetical protein
MFRIIVFNFLLLLLILSGAAVIYMGVFHAHRPGTGFGKKAFGAVGSCGLSALAWLVMYSYYYLGW